MMMIALNYFVPFLSGRLKYIFPKWQLDNELR